MTVRNAAGAIAKAAFCETFGVSEAQVERFFQQGMPHEKKGRRIMVPMPAARVWYHEYLVQKGRKQATPTDLDEVRKRREAIQTAMSELDYAERLSETMLTADFERVVADAFARVAAKLKNLPPRIAGVVLGAQTIQEAQARIEPLVREAMEELRAADDVPATDEIDEDAA